MTREDIINATGRIVDLRVFHDILTSGTPGGERLFDAIDHFKISNPMDLASYLLSNKDDILKFCDNEAAEIDTAKVCMLMYAAALGGQTESKDNALTNIVDNKYDIYDFVWNNAIKSSPAEAEKVLTGLPYDERVDFVKDVMTIFNAGGGLSERQQGLINRLNRVFGIEGDSEEKAKPKKKDSAIKKLPKDLRQADYDQIINHKAAEEEKQAEDMVKSFEALHSALSNEDKERLANSGIEIHSEEDAKAVMGLMALMNLLK